MSDDKIKSKIDLPDELAAIVLDGTVLYPNTILPVLVEKKDNVKLINDAVVGSKIIGVFSSRPEDESDSREPFEYGVAGSIMKFYKMPDDSIRILLQGLKRVKIAKVIKKNPYLRVGVAYCEDVVTNSLKIKALHRTIVEHYRKMSELSSNVPEDVLTAVINVADPSLLADYVAANLMVSLEERQSIIVENNLLKRMTLVSEILAREIKLLEIGSKIESEVSIEIKKSQKNYYIREQIKALKKELGEDNDVPVEVSEYRDKILEAKMPEDAQKVAEKELERLKSMSPASSEYSVTMTYLDWLVSVPWNNTTNEKIDIHRAEQILNEDHYGLDDIKERILEYLSVRKLNNEIKGPILCFVGPPGVGKTSLGVSIARSLDREFVRAALGGVRDEAEIRGHRRTYVGAMPGRIIRGIKQAGKNNPVFMLDEIDKLGSDQRGDPSSGLLEVLDPAQNNTFTDHYLDVVFDLSNVMFIATANDLFRIPGPLRDRMEIIQLPGYIADDKVHIAENYLVGRQKEQNGLDDKQISINRSAIRQIIVGYTREAGVRNLERKIGAVCRKVARQIVEGKTKQVKVLKADVEKYLGPQRVTAETAGRKDEVGIATGLAWTPVGGTVLFIEAAIMPGSKGFTLTGQLGNVMKESASAALSYIRSQGERLDINPEVFSKNDIHVHVPAGATPKDGPSAGITIATALASLLTGRKIRRDVAMTGEITLRGMVMPVGGVKEKVIAAQRAGIKTVILPKQNGNDLSEIPENIKSKLKFITVETIDEVWNIAIK